MGVTKHLPSIDVIQYDITKPYRIQNWFRDEWISYLMVYENAGDAIIAASEHHESDGCPMRAIKLIEDGHHAILIRQFGEVPEEEI